MNITKTIMTIGIASAMTMQFSACKETQHENSLLAESQLPYGAPDFSKIQVTDYLPAFEAATGDLMQMFTDFTGMRQPDASALLPARGL